MPIISYLLENNFFKSSEIAVLKAIYGELWTFISARPSLQHPLYAAIKAEMRASARGRLKRTPTLCKTNQFAAPSDRLMYCAWQLTLKHGEQRQKRRAISRRVKRSFHVTRDSDLLAMKAFVNFLNSSANENDDDGGVADDEQNSDYDFSTQTQSTDSNPSVYELFELALMHSRRRRKQ